MGFAGAAHLAAQLATALIHAQSAAQATI